MNPLSGSDSQWEVVAVCRWQHDGVDDPAVVIDNHEFKTAF